MAAFFVSSGGMSKKINEPSAKMAALAALRQWAICGQCNLGTILIVQGDADGDDWFSTTTLLDEMNVKYTINQDEIKLTNDPNRIPISKFTKGQDAV